MNGRPKLRRPKKRPTRRGPGMPGPYPGASISSFLFTSVEVL